MYRETIEHPYSIPDSIKAHLRLTNGNDRGRIWRIVPRGFARPPPPALSRASSLDLVFHLERPNAWWRETAQRLLLERADPDALVPLRAVARSDARSPFGRVHALWTLEGLGKLETEDVASALADENPRVREHAVRLAETRLRGNPGLLARLLPLAGDPDARVRFQLALTLGEADDRRAAAALARLASLDASDRWARAAILSSAGAGALDLLFELARTGEGSAGNGLRVLARSLAEGAGFAGRPGEMGRMIEIAVEIAGKDLRGAVLLGLGEGLRRSGKELSAALDPPGGVAAETAAKVRAFIEREAALAATSEAPLDERIEAIRLLAHAPFSLARGRLPALVDAREDRAIQIESVRSLSAHRDAGVAALLLEGWTRSSPEVRREILEALFGQEERIPPLLDSIESGAIAARSIDAVNRKRLLEHRSEAVRERARGLFRDQGAGDRKSALEEYRSALDLQGDRGRGREAFRKACATCHQLEGEVLTQILDPNRELLPVYNTYLVLTRDGRSITGIIASETAAGLTLKRAEAVEETVLRSAILKVEDTGLSLMPEGLEKDLRPQDLADLIAYLLSVR